MKKLVLFFVLILIVPAIAYADGPAFRVERTGKAGFTVTYSWNGMERGEPPECTVTVRVRYDRTGDKSKNGTNEEEFKLTSQIHNTGSGWLEFGSKSDLDNTGLSDVSSHGYSCRGVM
jgi:uncharacterized protein (DUF736 family)